MEWSSTHDCRKISEEATETFLGHPVKEYRVDNLFGQLGLVLKSFDSRN